MTNETKQLEALLTLKDVMQILKLKRDSIKDRISDGRLRAHMDGGAYRFRQCDVQEYIDNLEDAKG